MWEAHHITQSIARPPAEVVDFAADLSRWAGGVSDEAFAADVAAVTADLATLNRELAP